MPLGITNNIPLYGGLIMKIIKNNFNLFKLYFRLDPIYSIIKILSSFLEIIDPITNIYFFSKFLDGIFVVKSFKYCLNIILILTALNVFSLILNWYINNRLSLVSMQKINSHMTKEILNLYLKLDMKVLNDTNFYNKYQQVLNDIPNRMQVVQDDICTFLGKIFSISTIVALVSKIDIFIIIICILSVTISTLVSPLMNKINYKKYLAKTPKERELNYIKRIFYIFDYAKELKVLPISNLLLKKFDKVSDDIISIHKEYSFKIISTGILIGFISNINFAIIFIYIAYVGFKKSISFGAVGSLFNATQQFQNTLGSILSIFPKFDENSRYIENYHSIFEVKSTVENENIKDYLNKFEKISLENVNFKYDENKDYNLKNINFDIKKGEKIAIIGENGAGKSTLLNLILKLYDINSGNIKFNGIDYKNINGVNLRENFLCILQDTDLYSVSIAENILLKELETKEEELKVINALKRVGIYHKIEALEKGIYTIYSKEFDENGINFSGGEIQKIIAARIFVSNADIFILDEITSNLDAISEHKLFEQIDEYTNGKNMIYISHKLSTTKIADVIYVLDNGQILEKGNHQELMNKKGKYFEMFSVQAEKYGV